MDQLYYLALLPDSEDSRLFERYKDLAEEKYGCTVAKRSIAHITLVAPFRAPPILRQRLIQSVSRLATNSILAPLVNPIIGWGFFRQQTIYIAIQNSQELNQFYLLANATIKKMIAISDRKTFIPHITIVNRDLGMKQFTSAYEFFQTQPLPQEISCPSLVLFEHGVVYWQKLACFSLGSNV